jgi:hypothetical protein
MKLLPLGVVVVILGAIGVFASLASGFNLLLLAVSGMVLIAGVALLLAGVLVEVLSSFRPRKQYGGPALTQQGVVVRSNSERRIADYFSQNSIRYVYEEPAMGRRRRRISRPDFFLPDYDVYVEFWGLVDADDSRVREDYERNMKWKMAQYHRNGIKFISIYPKNLQNLDWIFRAKFRTVTGYDLPRGSNPSRPVGNLCTGCGRPLATDAKYCGQCGARVN